MFQQQDNAIVDLVEDENVKFEIEQANIENIYYINNNAIYNF